MHADKRYGARWLVDPLRARQLHLITKVRRNMGPVQHSPFDQALIKRRSPIATVFDELEDLYQVEDTRHRSHANFIVNLMSRM